MKKMAEERCFYCYHPLSTQERALPAGQAGYHERCSKKIFGKAQPAVLDYTNDQMQHLAESVIQSQIAVTGVQPKLSLGMQRFTKPKVAHKLTIMGVLGQYILKPPTALYPNLPELEDLTMHLATLAGIRTVPHTLIRLASGELAYLTKRVDRENGQKLHMEDFCQLTNRLTEAKYRGSYEQIGKAIVQHSANPAFDVISFFEQVVFCFLTGNNDMHLKNFSLLKGQDGRYLLSPAYDMVASSLVVEADDEELALTISGRKKNITHNHLMAAMQRFQINQRVFDNLFDRLRKALPAWHAFIDQSFVPTEMAERFHALIDERANRIKL